jgi:sugar lactone lactonase YvrE
VNARRGLTVDDKYIFVVTQPGFKISSSLVKYDCNKECKKEEEITSADTGEGGLDVVRLNNDTLMFSNRVDRGGELYVTDMNLTNYTMYPLPATPNNMYTVDEGVLFVNSNQWATNSSMYVVDESGQIYNRYHFVQKNTVWWSNSTLF